MRTRQLAVPIMLVGGAFIAAPAMGQWVNLQNQTASRMVSDAAVGISDTQEKDYAWGDLNNNGWIDLVVMRKQPFTSSGRRTNVLFMNENGVLVDRTQQYATATDVAGDQGFLTPTNDRDSVVVDLDNDGWRDVVTATTLSDAQPKVISHPRIYMNLGSQAGQWQGLRFENSRFPQLAGNANNGFPHAPRFCSVAAGDLTNNGYADLYFGDYDSGPSGQTLDFNNRLLINGGPGNPAVFTDQTTARLTFDMYNSAFGAASVIIDMNNNGFNDVVKQTSLTPPQHVAITYNNPANPGFFNAYSIVYNSAPYFVSAGDLNNNGRIDLVITDDGTDRYMLNQGNNASGHATFTSFTLPEYQTPGQNAFGSNSVIADLDKDGFADIMIADVDVDESGCNRHANIYRNNGNPPNVTFTRDWATIPLADMRGTFDFAVFDLTGNGWLDMVVGRCTGTNVWINIPPVNASFDYPQGRPTLVDPDETNEVHVEITAVGGAISSATFYVSVNGSAFTGSPLAHAGGSNYVGTLPAVACGSSLRYYVEVDMSGTIFKDPSNAPTDFYSALAAVEIETGYTNNFDGSVAGWTVWNHPSLSGGAWQQAVPLAVISGGRLASPDGDNSPNAFGQAFITQNCLPGQTAGQCDLDWGPTILTSPVIDLEGTNGIITYDRWVFCSTAANPATADFLYTEVSNNDGKTWAPVHFAGDTDGEWQTVSFLVSDYVTPTSTVRVRFVIEDALNNSITNALVDNFIVQQCVCGTTACTGDLNDSGAVDVQDLLILLGAWGPCGKGGCPADLNNSGTVDVQDLLILLGAWGPCGE
ncbi:MAG TPA: FG-GAP-like repeat-containing protein [Phycisphaerales bacterium]|nr:FG-GAP-like repeat-containing protein [Phycisphaerales bacterium]